MARWPSIRLCTNRPNSGCASDSAPAARVLRFEQLVGPHAEAVFVLGGHAEHVRDHDRRERVEHRDEVDRAVARAFERQRHELPRVRG